MKSILITGTNRGVGLELVRQLTQHPVLKSYRIIATCRNPDNAQELNEVARSHDNVTVLKLDVADLGSYERLVKQVENIVGAKGLNVLYHNAGYQVSKNKTIDELDPEELMSMYRINTLAPIMLTKAFLPLLRRASQDNSNQPMGINRSAIVYTSSFLASIASNNKGTAWGYRESKAAGNMAMNTIKLELQKDNIAVLMVHPGYVKTDMGGPEAYVEVSESVSGLLNLLMNLSEATNGAFIKFDGTRLPW